MWYISSKKNEYGGYSNPQSNKLENYFEIPEELIQDFIKYYGYVNLELDGDKVVNIYPNEEALMRYHAAQSAINTEKQPSLSTRIEELESALLQSDEAAIELYEKQLVQEAILAKWENHFGNIFGGL